MRRVRVILSKLLTALIQMGATLSKIASLLLDIKVLVASVNSKLDTISTQGGQALEIQTQLLDVGKLILDRLDTGNQAVKLTLYVKLEGEEEEREVSNNMAFIQPVDRTSKWSVKAQDKFGNAAPLDGPASFALADPAQGSFSVDENGVGTLTPAGVLGEGQVQVSGDADLGEGVVTLSGLGSVTFVAGQASQLVVEGVLDEPAPGGGENPVP